MQIFREATNRDSLTIIEEIPFAIEVYQGAPGLATYLNRDDCNIGCINCLNPRCLYFSEDEIECDYIEGFPSDKSIDVCPVGAITWNNNEYTPSVNPHMCINCGVCVSRCPVGALYFSENGDISINTVHSENTTTVPLSHETERIFNEQISQLMDLPRGGVILNASDEMFQRIYEKLFDLRSSYHNHVGRSLLISLGCKCSVRRIGDVYTRMDAIYSSQGGSFGAVEIEFGRDTLDASRGILDDIAVLNTRYGVSKENNNAIVICLQLPNARQGYWQVVKDINVVENIRIGTITVGALMYLLWNGCVFEPENSFYYIDYDNMDLRHQLCVQVDVENIQLTEKELGIFEPMK